jgi:hypothetical protein
MRAASGMVKVMDFGLAKSTETDLSMDITAAGRSILTPYYASIEQIRGQKNIDIRSDICSLGATLYHLVTGQFPFPGETPGEVMLKHAEQPVPDPRAARPELSVNLSRVLMKCMAKDPEDRYGEPGALLADLEAVAAGETPSVIAEAIAAQASARRSKAAQQREAPNDARPAKGYREAGKRKPVLPVAVAVGVAVAILVGAFVLMRSRGGDGTGTDSKGTATEKGGTKTTVPVKGETKAERMFKLAQSYANENPDEFDKILQAYELVLKQSPTGEIKTRVQEAIADCNREKAANEEIGKLEFEAQSLMGHQKYAEALKLFEQPPETVKETEVFRRRMSRLRMEIETRSRTEVSRFRSEADIAAKENVYSRAKQLYEEALAVAIPDDRPEIEKAIEAMAKLEAERNATLGAEQERKEEQAFQEVSRKLAELVAKRQYAEAEAACDQEAAKAGSGAVKEAVARLQADIKRLNDFWGHIDAYAQGTVGKTLVVERTSGTVTKVKDGSLFLEAQEKEVEFKVISLPLAKIRELVSKGVEEKQQAEAYAGLGLVHLYENEPADAAKLLQQAERAGADVSPYLARAEAALRERQGTQAKVAFDALVAEYEKKDWDVVARLFGQFRESFAGSEVATSQAAKLKEIEAEMEALAALDKVRAAKRFKKQDEALKLVTALLQQYPKSRVVESNREEIDKTLAWAESGDISPSLFAARKARIAKDGKTELLYEFEEITEFSGDWVNRDGVFPYGGRVHFGCYQGSTSGRGCFLRYVLHGDVEFKFDIRFIGDPPHCIVQVYGDYLILDGDRFALRKEMVNVRILEDILQKNPTPPKWLPKADNQVQVIRKGDQAALTVNGAVVHKWKSEEQTGQVGVHNLMLGSLCRGPAFLDNVLVRGTLDESTQDILARQAVLLETAKRGSPKRGGLMVEYFADTKFRKRLSVQLGLPFGMIQSRLPAGTVPAEKYAIRWSGYILAPAAGSYSFSTQTRLTGTAVVTVDDKLKFSASAPDWKSQQWELSPGLHKFELEYTHQQEDGWMESGFGSNVDGHRSLSNGYYFFYDEGLYKKPAK